MLQAGKVVAKAGAVEGSARVRVFGALPWSEDFEGGKVPGPLGRAPAGSRSATRPEGKILSKGPVQVGLNRATVFIGPATMKGYTIESDVRATKKGRRMGDVGLINNGYTLDMQGVHQKLQVRSWASELSFSKEVPFTVESDVWYRMKLVVEPGNGEDHGARQSLEARRGRAVRLDDRVRRQRGHRSGRARDLWRLARRHRLGQSQSHFESLRSNDMRRVLLPVVLIAVFLGSQGSRPVGSQSPERGLFGEFPTRNSVSAEKGLPSTWDADAGTNILWSQPAGSQSYAGPMVAGGRVFIGTNNEGNRNPKIKGDRGVVMAFDAKSGEFVWQMATEKLSSGRVNDWPQQGVCSTPFVEGDRLYYTSNQAKITALDVAGLKNGNDGVTDEKETSPIDGDVIWSFDLMGEADVFPHNLAASSPLVVDGILYATTGNGVDEGHVNIPSPLAPSFVAIDQKTGKLVWESAEPGSRIIHGNWSNAAYGMVKGRPQVVFGGGDGWVYSFEPKTGKLIWKFNANPKDAVYRLGGSGTKNDIIATPVVYDDKVFIGVGQDPGARRGGGEFLGDRRHPRGRHHGQSGGVEARGRRVPSHHLHRRHP